MFKQSPSWMATAVVLSGVLASLPLVAEAQVFKCSQPDGSTTFQQSPCPGNIKAPAAPPADAKPASSRAEPYFDPYAPVNVRQRAAEVSLPATHPNPVAPPVAQAERRRPEEPEASPRAPAAPSAEQQQVTQENERVKAYNKSVMCNNARQQLGVLKVQRPVYRVDNNGERHYVDDKDRQKETDAAQQRVYAECQ